jgi:large subunit ribosomal protein L16
MGRGKGSPALKVFPMKAGKILFEFKNVEESLLVKALKSSAIRLPIKTVIIKKYDKRSDSIKGG